MRIVTSYLKGFKVQNIVTKCDDEEWGGVNFSLKLHDVTHGRPLGCVRFLALFAVHKLF